MALNAPRTPRTPFFITRRSQYGVTDTSTQKATGSIERDENYVPYHRDDFNLPPRKEAHKADYAEIFEETPLFTLLRVLIMQGLYVTFGQRMSRSY